MFNLINSLLSFLGNLFKSELHRERTADVVTVNSGFTSLTTFQYGKSFGLAVKLLNLPAQATRILYGLRVALSKIVGYDINSVSGKQNHTKQFHFMVFWKAL